MVKRRFDKRRVFSDLATQLPNDTVNGPVGQGGISGRGGVAKEEEGIGRRRRNEGLRRDRISGDPKRRR